MKQKLVSLERVILILILITINITKVINIGNIGKFNVALSDIFVPFIFCYFIIRVKNESFKAVFKEYGLFLVLIFWILITGVFSIINRNILDAGIIGIIEELIKTIICVFYFWIGYNVLKEISFETFKKSWIFSLIVFIFGGLILFLSASNALFYWSNDPKYMYMFMGTDTDPNHAATYLSLSFFAMGIFGFISSTKNAKTMSMICMLISAFGVILTTSRGGVLGLLVGLTLLFVFYAFKNIRLALTLFLSLVLVLLIFLQFDMYILDRYFTERLIYKIVDFSSGFETRFNLGKVAFMMGNDHPFFGVGRGNYILNSLDYFRSLNAEFIDNIPHNTFLGLYAETGLIGVLLFFSPFLLVLKSIYQRRFEIFKGDKTIIVWLCAGALTLSIQAFVLNVENRRFLWFLAGLLLYLIDNNQLVVNTLNPSKNKESINAKSNIILFLCTLGLLIFSMFTVNINNRPVSVKDKYELKLPYLKIYKSNSYEVWTTLSIEGDQENANKVKIEVVEIAPDGSEIELYGEVYSGLKGNLKIKFTPNRRDSDIFVRFLKIDKKMESFDVQVNYISNTNEAVDLTKRYFMMPQMLTEFIQNYDVVPIDELIKQTDIGEFDEAIFDDLIKINAIDYKLSASNTTVVILECEVLNDISKRYYPYLHGVPDDFSYISKEVRVNGSENYPLIGDINTSLWRKGESYIISFEIPRQIGNYALFNGFYCIENDVLKYLNYNQTNQFHLYLGNLNLDRK